MFMVEIPRWKVRQRDQEMGAQTVARFRLCSDHADNVLERDKHSRAYEMPGWLNGQPCKDAKRDVPDDDDE